MVSTSDIEREESGSENKNKKRQNYEPLEDQISKILKSSNEESLPQNTLPVQSIVPNIDEIRTLNKPTIKRRITIAVPGSILNTLATLQLKTMLANQLARYCAVFRVNEIVVFDDFDAGGGHIASTRESCSLLTKLLEFQIIPQYLRKFLFSIDQDLIFSSLLHPLATPNHMKKDEFSKYRTGITLDQFNPSDGYSLADCGLDEKIILNKRLKPDLCVTVKFDKKDPSRGKVVSPKKPFTEGYYWGYSVRIVDGVNDIFTDSSGSRYDSVIGTSDKGDCISEITFPEDAENILVVFGGVNGLEFAFKNDRQNLSATKSSVNDFFDFYLNCCPNQGSRTIRTEEAIPIVLTSLQAKLKFL